MNALKKIKNYIEAHDRLILTGLIMFYILSVFGLLIFKYNHYGYNAIDLGIYNQVFFNSSHGQLFNFTVHPHSYLGDHFELFMIFLLPFYLVASSPLTLIFLQTACLALSAWPLYLIARKKLSQSISLGLALAWLINPFVWNTNFFEFHLLPFAILLLLTAFYFYRQNKFGWFLLLIALCLSVREDVALVIVMFGGLALIDKRKIKWVLAPIILGGVWFIVAWQLIGYFNDYGTYKFLSMYGWLGSTPRDMLLHFFTQPWLVARQIFSMNNIFFTIGLLVPLLGLPLFKPRYLLLALLVFIQLLLASVNGTVVLETHYAALLLPCLFIASIFALAEWQEKNNLSAIKRLILKQKSLYSAILIVAMLYSFFTFSPFITSLVKIFNNRQDRDLIAEKNNITGQVGADDSVAAGFDYLPKLSSRPELYSLHYAFLGKKQYSDEDYSLPPTVNKLAVDFQDFIYYYLQSQNNASYTGQYATGAERINQLITQGQFGVKTIVDDQALYEKNYSSSIKLVEKNIQAPANLTRQPISNRGLAFLGWEQIPATEATAEKIIPLSLYWQAQQKIGDDYQLALSLSDSSGKTVYQKIYPLAYGLYPTSYWSPGETVKTNYWFLVPAKYDLKKYSLSLQAVSLKGYMGLDGWRSAKNVITVQSDIGPAIPIYFNTR